MAARKTPVKKPAAKAAAAPAVAPEPETPLAPGESASYRAAVAGLAEIVDPGWQRRCRSISYLYFHKCITPEERAALECFVVAQYHILPERVVDKVDYYESDFIDDTKSYAAEKKRKAEEQAN